MADNNQKNLIEYVKEVYASGRTIPGMKTALLRTFMHGSMENKLREAGFDGNNWDESRIPEFIDAALNADVIGARHFLMGNLFLSVADAKELQIPMDVVKTELSQSPDFILDANTRGNIGSADMMMDSGLSALKQMENSSLSAVTGAISLVVDDYLVQENEFIADMRENMATVEGAAEKIAYVTQRVDEFYGQLAQAHPEAAELIERKKKFITNMFGIEDQTQTQQTEATQPLGIEDHTADRPRTPEELIEISRRQMERERAQATEQTASAQVAEPKVETPLERNPLLLSLCKTFEKADETGLYMADTIMLALGFASSEVALVGQHGVQDVAGLIGEKVKYEDLNDAQLINGLFNLEQEYLDQMPISFYADLVKCPAFSYADKDKQNQIFGKILKTIGIESFDNLDKIEPDKVAYNHKAIKDIFGAYFAINAKDKNQEGELNQFLNSTINEKLQQVLDNAPELNADPEKRNNLLNLVDKHKGDYYQAADEVLGMFNDTKALQDEQLNSVALGSSGEYYHPVSNAKTVLAEYKLGAYAEAGKALGIINEKNAENITLINPKDKDKHEAQFITMAKNTMANFAKPQNIAKIATRTIATQAITRGISHLVGGAVPGVGAAVCLAMKLGECGKRIFKDKENPKEVFAQSAADLARGAITVGLSFTPVMPIAGPIAAVAATAIRGVQAAHKEGLKVGKGFFKRVVKEFTKKSNLINLGLSTAGAAIGIGARAGMQHYHDMKAAAELDDQSIDAISGAAPQAEEVVQPQSGYEQYQAEQLEDYQQYLHDQHDAMVFPQNDGIDATIPDGQNTIPSHEIPTQEIPNNEIPQGVPAVEPEPELSYVEQYLKDHPGSHLDKNGWVQNADGSYAKNEAGQLFGADDRVFRDLKANEMLDKAGNIVEKPSLPTQEWNDGTVASQYYNDCIAKGFDYKGLDEAGNHTFIGYNGEVYKINPTDHRLDITNGKGENVMNIDASRTELVTNTPKNAEFYHQAMVDSEYEIMRAGREAQRLFPEDPVKQEKYIQTFYDEKHAYKTLANENATPVEMTQAAMQLNKAAELRENLTNGVESQNTLIDNEKLNAEAKFDALSEDAMKSVENETNNQVVEATDERTLAEVNLAQAKAAAEEAGKVYEFNQNGKEYFVEDTNKDQILGDGDEYVIKEKVNLGGYKKETVVHGKIGEVAHQSVAENLSEDGVLTHANNEYTNVQGMTAEEANALLKAAQAKETAETVAMNDAVDDKVLTDVEKAEWHAKIRDLKATCREEDYTASDNDGVIGLTKDGETVVVPVEVAAEYIGKGFRIPRVDIEEAQRYLEQVRAKGQDLTQGK